MFKTIVTLSCNTPNCKTAPVTGEERTPTFFAARKAGWECINAAEQYCPACKALRHPKAEKVAKATKAETKKAADTKATTKVAKNTKVTKPVAKNTKATVATKATTKTTKPVAQPAAFAGGQSIGKVAKSAKK